MAIQQYLKENKLDEFFELNNITLEEYQEFKEWNASRFNVEKENHIHATESPGTTSTTLSPLNSNSSLLNVTTIGNLTTPSNITNPGEISPTPVTTNSTIATNSTPTTTMRTTTPKYMRWLQHRWRFNETWTSYLNETATPDTPEWYVDNRTLPDIDIIGVLSNISYEELLKNTTEVIKQMKISNFTGSRLSYFIPKPFIKKSVILNRFLHSTILGNPIVYFPAQYPFYQRIMLFRFSRSRSIGHYHLR